VEVMQKFRSI